VDHVESVVATTAAVTPNGEIRGTLVLTTQRLLFVVGTDEVRYEVRREEVASVRQDLRTLCVWRGGEGRGMCFELATERAGPVRWDWYLGPVSSRAGGTETSGLGHADDPRVGPVDDEVRRATLATWDHRLEPWSVAPSLTYLDDLPEHPFAFRDAAEIVYVVDGDEDGPSWMIVVRLPDGRWLYGTHVVQITGEAYVTVVIARARDPVVGCLHRGRARPRDRADGAGPRRRDDGQARRAPAVARRPAAAARRAPHAPAAPASPPLIPGSGDREW
jgi:hypothetical protein